MWQRWWSAPADGTVGGPSYQWHTVHVTILIIPRQTWHTWKCSGLMVKCWLVQPCSERGSWKQTATEQVLEPSHISSYSSWPFKWLDVTWCQCSLWALLERKWALRVRKVHLSHRLSRTGVVEIDCMHDVVHWLYFLCFSLQCDINLKIKTKRRLYSYFFVTWKCFLKERIF